MSRVFIIIMIQSDDDDDDDDYHYDDYDDDDDMMTGYQMVGESVSACLKDGTWSRSVLIIITIIMTIIIIIIVNIIVLIIIEIIEIIICNKVSPRVPKGLHLPRFLKRTLD